MNQYYSLSEKRDYIDADFKESKLYNMDSLPTDKEEQSAYFHNAIKYGGEFIDKYKGKGWSYDYALMIVNDWMDNLERIARGEKR